jgi:hypothetical protein
MAGYSNYFTFSAYFGGADAPPANAPLVNFPAMQNDAPDPGRILVRCVEATEFSAVHARFTDFVAPSNSAYYVLQVYEIDADGAEVGAWLATGTTQLSGDSAFENDPEAGIVAFQELTFGLTDGAFTIGAGNAAKLTFTPVGGGVDLPQGVVYLIPA